MKNVFNMRTLLFMAVILSTLTLLMITACSDFGKVTIPLRIVYTSEVRGYLEPCG
jgi:hypothetical protein